MIMLIDFDSLDSYCAEYGSFIYVADILKIYVEGGLGVPDDLKPLFHRHYLHDQWRDIKYDKWNVIDGVLHAHIDGAPDDKWVEYDKKNMANEIVRYEFFGDCWFVFEGVTYFKRTVFEHNLDQKTFTDKESTDEMGHTKFDSDVREYILEGKQSSPPLFGAVTWWIHAKEFHIEIPDE